VRRYTVGLADGIAKEGVTFKLGTAIEKLVHHGKQLSGAHTHRIVVCTQHTQCHSLTAAASLCVCVCYCCCALCVCAAATGKELKGPRGYGYGVDVHLANGETESFDGVVVCAGVKSRDLAAQLGDRVNIYPVKGYSITVNLHDEASKAAAPWVSLLDDKAKIVTSRLGPDRFRIAGTAEFNGYNKVRYVTRVRVRVRACACVLLPAAVSPSQAHPHAASSSLPHHASSSPSLKTNSTTRRLLFPPSLPLENRTSVGTASTLSLNGATSHLDPPTITHLLPSSHTHTILLTPL